MMLLSHNNHNSRSPHHHHLLLLQVSLVISVLFSLFGDIVGSWRFIIDLNMHALGAGVVCDNVPGLIGRQRRLCSHHPDVMVPFSQGAKMAVDECQQRFKHQRWNCSSMGAAGDTSLFGKLMQRGSREAAFVYAISSAGVAHSITRACSRGQLANCACDPRRRGSGRDEKGIFEWGGCSDNVQYGATFSRVFIDAKENKQRDARALMNLHNNRAGRRAVKKFRKIQCKCHGVSGNCTVRTCWLAMQRFQLVASHLKMLYNGATQVRMSQNGASLVVANRNHKKPTRSDLVYLESSPDYCVPDPQSGSLGTEGRACNKSSMGTDGCDIMCCGRGFHTRVVRQKYKCECKFHWCCHVKCKECHRWVELHTCKGFRYTN